MAILKDITEVEGNQGNLAQDIKNTFTEFEAEKANEGIGLLAESLTEDNLTQYSKDNGMLNYTSRALVLNAFANGHDFYLQCRASRHKNQLERSLATILNQDFHQRTRLQ